MAFFTQSGLSPLFLFNDYEAPTQYKSRQCPKSYQCSKPQARSSSFAPAFDVRELTNAYHLDGELPGVDQSNIEIEFTDPHTLVIKGHTDREYINDDTESNNDASSSRTASPAGWHQATVEDEDAESTSSADTAASNTPTHPAENDQPHFWTKERSIGNFQRTFSFTARVDQDSVRASLKNGVLSVVVPKEAAPTPKKIRIL
ncbi:HSP20-like chaperone [Penicillium expansum]|nr:HSP20-like chaperone [Penicillium expansum]